MADNKVQQFDHLVFLDRISKDPVLAEYRGALQDINIKAGIDIDRTVAELGELGAVELPTSFIDVPVGKINEVLARVQAYRDRCSAMKGKVAQAIYYYSRLFSQASDHLRLSYNEVRELKSEEMRKAISSEALREFETPLARAEFAQELIKITMDNLMAKNENASRQLSVISAQIEIGEIQKKFPN